MRSTWRRSRYPSPRFGALRPDRAPRAAQRAGAAHLLDRDRGLRALAFRGDGALAVGLGRGALHARDALVRRHAAPPAPARLSRLHRTRAHRPPRHPQRLPRAAGHQPRCRHPPLSGRLHARARAAPARADGDGRGRPLCVLPERLVLRRHRVQRRRLDRPRRPGRSAAAARVPERRGVLRGRAGPRDRHGHPAAEPDDRPRAGTHRHVVPRARGVARRRLRRADRRHRRRRRVRRGHRRDRLVRRLHERGARARRLHQPRRLLPQSPPPAAVASLRPLLHQAVRLHAARHRHLDLRGGLDRLRHSPARPRHARELPDLRPVRDHGVADARPLLDQPLRHRIHPDVRDLRRRRHRPDRAAPRRGGGADRRCVRARIRRLGAAVVRRRPRRRRADRAARARRRAARSAPRRSLRRRGHASLRAGARAGAAVRQSPRRARAAALHRRPPPVAPRGDRHDQARRLRLSPPARSALEHRPAALLRRRPRAGHAAGAVRLRLVSGRALGERRVAMDVGPLRDASPRGERRHRAAPRGVVPRRAAAAEAERNDRAERRHPRPLRAVRGALAARLPRQSSERRAGDAGDRRRQDLHAGARRARRRRPRARILTSLSCMGTRMTKLCAMLLVLFTACASAPPPAAAPAPAPAPVVVHNDIATKTAKMQKLDGYLPLFWDADAGKLYLQIARPGEEMIHVTGMAGGVGSTPIGLDRGGMGESRLVRFDRVGPKVLLVQLNERYRALSNDENERRGVEDSFAKSVLWGFKVEASEGDGVLVAAPALSPADQHAIAAPLPGAKQGSYTLDRNRSAIFLPRTKAFPRNTEVEATLTFETHERPGRDISSVARTGWEKKDPGGAVSEPVAPIVYYVDPGAPEPIRSAIIEGVSWWNQAFEAAGFRNAFQVKVLPPDADPMDVRYNTINWVHRATRGWSFGGAVIDPRTGEIIKGNVVLGSQRIRQDVLIAGGLIPQYDELHDRALAELDPATSPAVMALARIRQLAAHEVGHTLGLAHNMAASSYGRASVMDYPSPTVKIVDGKLDLSDAYAKGLGASDLFSIKYPYGQFANDEELDRFVREEAPTHLYINDPHARPVSAAHPLASVWDAPGDPIAALRHESEVRRIALSQFGLRNLAVGEPLSSLEEKLVPLFLHHRYQLEAAAKSIGGIDYTYSVKENGAIVPQPVRHIVTPERQRDAMAAVLSTLEPSFLEIPQRILNLIPPRADTTEGGVAELFEHRTTPAFDPVSAAMTSAEITLDALLDARRAARMAQFHAENAKNPDFTELVDDVIAVTTRRESGYRGAITRAAARPAPPPPIT